MRWWWASVSRASTSAGVSDQVSQSSRFEYMTDRGAVHGGDDGLAHVPGQGVEGRGTERRLVTLAERGAALAKVRTGAEGGRRSGQHDDTDGVVAVAAAVGVRELVAHAVAERVA